MGLFPAVKTIGAMHPLCMSWLSILVVAAAACSQPTDSGAQDDSVGDDDDNDHASDSADNDDDSAGDDDDDNNDNDDDTGDDDGKSDDPGNDSEGLPNSKFDLGNAPDLEPGTETGECDIDHTPCDEDSDDPWHAIGVNCPGEIQVDGTYSGEKEALGVFDRTIGTAMPATWPILEGKRYAVLSSGKAESVFTPGECDPGTPFPPRSQRLDFPAPINPMAVDGDCTTNPALIGTGDCSKTLEAQWMEASISKGNDWAELRFTLKVPDNVNGFAFDFAFLSVEYPIFFGSTFNDLFVAWLESETWTGNISFDKDGKPISLNAGFLDYKDGGALAGNDPSCPPPCEAPELAGSGVEEHAATKWLTTTAGVKPGETITVVFGVIDLADDILDAIVLLDNFRWLCEGGPPQTNPK